MAYMPRPSPPLLQEALPRRLETMREELGDGGMQGREYGRTIEPRGIAEKSVGDAAGF